MSYRKCLLTVLSAILLFGLSSFPVHASDTQTQAARICQLEKDSDQAYIAHDRTFLTSLFADEFQHTNFRGGVVDKNTEVDFFTSPDFNMKAATIDSCAAHIYQRVAVVTGINTWTEAIYKGHDLSASYRFTRVYVRRKGRWQVVASHFSKITPA